MSEEIEFGQLIQKMKSSPRNMGELISEYQLYILNETALFEGEQKPDLFLLMTFETLWVMLIFTDLSPELVLQFESFNRQKIFAERVVDPKFLQ